MATKKTDVLIIGGGPAGFTCATSACNTYLNKTVTLIRRDEISVIPCGIPYVISSLDKVEDNILGDKKLLDCGVDIVVDEVVGFEGKTAILASGDKMEFDKLVLATGSRPTKPTFPGSELDGVFVVDKSFDFLKVLKERIQKASSVFIVGGGFIGLEIADEILKQKKNVTVCCRSSFLRSAFDPEFCALAKAELEKLGANMIDGTQIKELTGNGSVSAVVLDNGETVEADVVIFGIGYDANISLAEELGLEIQNGFIKVDEYMRTTNKDVFAVGDCAIKREYFSRNQVGIMLASTAMAEGRLAGSNLYRLNVVREFKGTLGTFATRFGNLSIGATGLTEKNAKAMGFNYTIGTAQAPDRHPGKLKDASKVTMKLVFSPTSHTLLGAQVAGGTSVGEMVNILSIMIQKGFSDIEVDTMQLGTHPLLTASPVAYPIINATVNAIVNSGWGENN